MFEDTEDVIVDSSPQDVIEDVVDSQDQQDISEEGTPQQPDIEEDTADVQEDEQRVPYDRFKGKVDEVNWLKQQNEMLLRGQQPVQPQQQPSDPYVGMDAETEKFYRAIDQRTKQMIEQNNKHTQQVIEAGKQEIAVMQARQFYKDHPDVKKGSPEEAEIAQYVGQGLALETAYKAAMFDRIKDQTETKVKKQVKQRVQLKKRANTESGSGIPRSAQPKDTRSLREVAMENFLLAEQGKL